MVRRLRTLRRETFSSLKTRNFRLFFVGQLISQSGSWLTLIAQTLLVLKPVLMIPWPSFERTNSVNSNAAWGCGALAKRPE